MLEKSACFFDKQIKKKDGGKEDARCGQQVIIKIFS